jgi:hypothetical protein
MECLICVPLWDQGIDRGPPWPFRFQKRVSLKRGAKRFGLPVPEGPDPTNVGHFSVRADPATLLGTDLSDIPASVIKLIHRDAAVLERRSARLGGFDAVAFRSDILLYLEEVTIVPD